VVGPRWAGRPGGAWPGTFRHYAAPPSGGTAVSLPCLAPARSATRNGRDGQSIGAADLLEAVRRFRSYLVAIRTDQGPEFTGRALDQLAQANRMKLLLIQPGKPTQNAYVESFNGKSRDECLNENWFTSIEHAKAVISVWRRDYNEVRPYNSLGKSAPVDFAARLREQGLLAPNDASDNSPPRTLRSRNLP